MVFTPGVEQVLDLPALINALLADDLLSRSEANKILSQERTREQQQMHPLSYVASQQPESKQQPDRVLSHEKLSQWLAGKAGLEVRHIDPLNVNVAEVTSVMSYEFAQRHDILCIELSDREAVIATDQPFVTGGDG